MIFCKRRLGRGAKHPPLPLLVGPQAITLDVWNIDIGAGEEIRTLDPNLGKVVLYH